MFKDKNPIFDADEDCQTCCDDVDDQVIYCDGYDCGAIIHFACYGIKGSELSSNVKDKWYCDVCKHYKNTNNFKFKIVFLI